MNINDIKSKLGENDVICTDLKLTAINNIMKYVTILLKLDKSTMSYYYSIKVNDLISSKMPIDDLDDLKEEGWAFDKNGENLILYLNSH